MTYLSANQLIKRYHSKTVVNNVSFKLEQGQILGLLGPNGAGKTTCFYMIVGLIKSDSGQILLNNHDITRYPMHKRAKLGLGYLPQEASIFRKLTVENNILAILETQPEMNKASRYEKLETLLDEFNLIKVRYSIGMSLSGGERRRVEIARALASNPQFILLDEPFAGVDPISVSDIKNQISYLTKKRKIGILITDHNVRETLSICDEALIMNEGSTIAHGKPSDILNHSQVKAVYLGDKFNI